MMETVSVRLCEPDEGGASPWIALITSFSSPPSLWWSPLLMITPLWWSSHHFHLITILRSAPLMITFSDDDHHHLITPIIILWWSPDPLLVMIRGLALLLLSLITNHLLHFWLPGAKAGTHLAQRGSSLSILLSHLHLPQEDGLTSLSFISPTTSHSPIPPTYTPSLIIHPTFNIFLSSSMVIMIMITILIDMIFMIMITILIIMIMITIVINLIVNTAIAHSLPFASRQMFPLSLHWASSLTDDDDDDNDVDVDDDDGDDDNDDDDDDDFSLSLCIKNKVESRCWNAWNVPFAQLSHLWMTAASWFEWLANLECCNTAAFLTLKLPCRYF